VDYGITIRTAASFAEAVARVREALKAQGFGVLTEIDVQATLRDKLGEDMEPYLILGACNPPLAHRALAADRSIGLLLPCNVVVRAESRPDRHRGSRSADHDRRRGRAGTPARRRRGSQLAAGRPGLAGRRPQCRGISGLGSVSAAHGPCCASARSRPPECPPAAWAGG